MRRGKTHNNPNSRESSRPAANGKRTCLEMAAERGEEETTGKEWRAAGTMPAGSQSARLFQKL